MPTAGSGRGKGAAGPHRVAFGESRRHAPRVPPPVAPADPPPPVRAVLDTNVLVAGLRSRAAASNRVLRLVTAGQVTPVVTVPLWLEYQDVLKRPGKCPLTLEAVDGYLAAFLELADRRHWHPRPEPTLTDADDERVLRASLAAGGCPVVTHNVRHFAAADVPILTPAAFLAALPDSP